eukprot:NODE_3_length_56144_cov_0.348184.p12 type:complete len:298 gc:universal NODE_3_length_56144_cov_0.348184:10336-11229(+)
MKHLNVQSFLKLRPSLTDVGLIPTMGALHEGHLSLIKQSLKSSKVSVVSIFVNPTQFAVGEDLSTYPRTLDSDMKKLMSLDHENIILLTPTINEMYPNGVDSVYLDTPKGQLFEGKIRPTFFRGVCTIVCKLFNLVSPNVAYFGQKDIQQASIISRLVNDLLLPIKVVVVPTIRESDGLALSSRNIYLDNYQRIHSIALYYLLTNIKSDLLSGIPVSESIQSNTKSFSFKYPQFQIQYLDVVNAATMNSITTVDPSCLHECSDAFEISNEVVSVVAAIKISNSLRLLDNMVLINKSV